MENKMTQQELIADLRSRKEAAEKIAEAQRIEDGLSADQDAVYAAVEAARARIDAKKVGAGGTAMKGKQ